MQKGVNYKIEFIGGIVDGDVINSVGDFGVFVDGELYLYNGEPPFKNQEDEHVVRFESVRIIFAEIDPNTYLDERGRFLRWVKEDHERESAIQTGKWGTMSLAGVADIPTKRARAHLYRIAKDRGTVNGGK